MSLVDVSGGCHWWMSLLDVSGGSLVDVSAGCLCWIPLLDPLDDVLKSMTTKKDGHFGDMGKMHSQSGIWGF